jgi:hypothetical protein
VEGVDVHVTTGKETIVVAYENVVPFLAQRTGYKVMSYEESESELAHSEE